MIWWAAALLFQNPQFLELPTVDKNPFTSLGDLATGKKLFAARCAGCHGPAGDGGKGTNLAVAILPRATDDLSLYRVIRFGLQDTEMPQHNLAPREIWQLAAYVRTLGKVQNGPITGDPNRGAELLRGKGGCLQCHAIGVEGGRLGPALSDIGARRGPAYLRAKILDPIPDIPDQFRMVQLQTKSGHTVSGIRLNEDTWSIQVRDMKDNLHSFWKADLTQLKEDHRTPMPSYRGRLNDKEIDDVVAYLTAMRGDR